MNKLTVWALFDSGNGCYKQAQGDNDVISIGLNEHEKTSAEFISMDLSQDVKAIIKELSKLPRPDLIIASPPCESWSNASAISGGNACWRQTLKDPEFNIRKRSDFDGLHKFKPKFYPSLRKRLAGEILTVNTVMIIEHFKPKFWVIENPYSSRIWQYMGAYLGFNGIKNKAHYNNYDASFPKKPTCFMSNIDLYLRHDDIKTGTAWRDRTKNYNLRSNIPIPLVADIFGQLSKMN